MGVCLHHGNLGGGHYTSIVRKGNSHWVHYNDHMIQPLPQFPEHTPEHIIQQELEKIIHNPAVYCLVYRKIIR
jgi:ubiquitin C-terminal hydrolase